MFLWVQGPPLAENLRRQLTGVSLQPHVPQTSNLALITMGDKYCMGVKGWLGELMLGINQSLALRRCRTCCCSAFQFVAYHAQNKALPDFASPPTSDA